MQGSCACDRVEPSCTAKAVGQSGSDQLQPERLVEARRQGVLGPAPGNAAADDEAVAAVGVKNIFAEMLDDRFAHPLAQNAGSREVGPEVEGALVHADVGNLVQTLQHHLGPG